jgi:hypothetical protein
MTTHAAMYCRCGGEDPVGEESGEITCYDYFRHDEHLPLSTVDNTAIGNTAIGNTAIGNTAIGSTVIGSTATIGNTEIGNTAID